MSKLSGDGETAGFAGQIRIRLQPGGHQQVAVSCERPLQVCRLLEKRSPSEALQRLPLLFSLCARSQLLAGQLALAAAVSRPVDPQVERDALLEALQEHMWRLLTDLPRVLDKSPAIAELIELRRLIAELSQLPPTARQSVPGAMATLIEGTLTGGPLADWWAADDLDPLQWMRGRSWLCPLLLSLQELLSAVEPVATTTQKMTDQQIDTVCRALARQCAVDEALISQPQWQGQPLQTGTWCYHQSHPLLRRAGAQALSPVLVRLLARLLDTADIMERLRTESRAVSPRSGSIRLAAGEGCGWVKTARGLLFHYVQLQDDQLLRYRIVAPTEWNFHPQGILAEELRAQAELALDQRLLTRLRVLSLDPCVPYKLEIVDA